MNRMLTPLALVAALTLPAATDAQTESERESKSEVIDIAKLPAGAIGFNGQIRGVVLQNPRKLKNGKAASCSRFIGWIKCGAETKRSGRKTLLAARCRSTVCSASSWTRC